MDTIRELAKPVALLASWMAVAAYVLVQVGQTPAMPTVQAPEVVIVVTASAQS